VPRTEIIFFAEKDGTAPALQWLDRQPEKVQNKFIVRIERLAECGPGLRRPEAAYLRDGVHELRVRHLRVNYRLLYFFHRQRIVLSHGLTKERTVPEREIERAIRRFQRFRTAPSSYTYRG